MATTPATPSSPASQLTNFGRAWSISVTTPDGTTYQVASSTNESLRVQFEIETFLLMVFWRCTLTIWNLSYQTAESIIAGSPSGVQLWKQGLYIQPGDTVTISAGYQYGPSGSFQPNANIIYQGQVLQPRWIRDNVVDAKLVLNCYTGLQENSLTFVNRPLAAGADDYSLLDTISQQSGIAPLDVDDASVSALTASKYPRGVVLNGRPFDLISSILSQHGLQGWVGRNGLSVRRFGSTNWTAPNYSYGAPPVPGGITNVGPTNTYNTKSSATSSTIIKPTILGVPQQTPYGLRMRVQMDSQPQIGDVIQLAPGTLINPVQYTYGSLPPVPSQSGLYAVAGVRYVGDSRDDEWYTEIEGVVQDFFSLLDASLPLQAQSVIPAAVNP